MMLSYRTKQTSRVSLLYFVYSGWIIAIALGVTGLVRLQLGPLGWSFTKQLLAVGIAMLVTCVLVAVGRPGIFSRASFEVAVQAAPSQEVPPVLRFPVNVNLAIRIVRWLGIAFYALAPAALSILDHRVFLVFIAAVTAYIASLWLGPKRKVFYGLFAAVLASSWILESGLSYTHLADWLLSAGSSESLALPALLISTLLVISEMSRARPGAVSRSNAALLFGAAFIVFLALALRTDNLMREWVPLHRSYFADTAQYVREGHWLLWDIPSLYGFLSIVTLVILPTSNGWESLSLLTAGFLVIQSCIVFLMLRWGQSGWRNALFAVFFPAATILMGGIARYPLSSRLYPQGGMRFFFVSLLLFVAFLSYVWRDDARRIAALRWLGWWFWCVSLFWSVENGVWATVIWLPYIIAAKLCEKRDATVGSYYDIARSTLKELWPAFAFPVTVVALVDVYYRIRLGAFPDWHAYVEFLGFFTTGVVRKIFFVQPFGAGWTLLLFLCATGALVLVILREGRWQLLPLALAAWLAVWSTSSYFAVEPLDLYVVLLLAVLAPVGAIVIFISRQQFRDKATPIFARFTVAPVAIIAIALALGGPSRFADMRLPLTPGWTLDTSQVFPPMSGELAALFKRAKIQPADKVLVPNGEYWTEPKQGIIFPFTRLADGRVHEYSSWLPVSPVPMTLLSTGIGTARRTVYIERTLAISKSGGWYVTYRQDANCGGLSPHLKTVKTFRSTNFIAALCAYTSAP